MCLGVRSGPSREGAASGPAAVPQPRRGRWRRPLAQGGPGLLLREEMRREGRRRWRSRRGSAVRRPWLFVSPPFPPLPWPRPAILPGPLPAASSPPARNALVRAEAEPRWRRQLRRARDPPHAPGSASFWLGSGRLCRVSAPAGVGGKRPVRPLAGRAGEGWCRRARSGRPPVLQAPAKRSRSCPGLGKAPKRLRLFLLGERSVWQQSAREVRNARFWPQSRVAPFEEGPRTAGRGEELPRLQTHAVAELSGDCPGLGISCPYRRFVLSPCWMWTVLGGCSSLMYINPSLQDHLHVIQAERTGR